MRYGVLQISPLTSHLFSFSQKSRLLVGAVIYIGKKFDIFIMNKQKIPLFTQMLHQ